MHQYQILLAELDNASKRCGHYGTNRKFRELIAYLSTLQETGNYLLAQKAVDELGE